MTVQTRTAIFAEWRIAVYVKEKMIA